jgi:4-amino-4-deoxy-L-arabinose transferase-like glycosyltransferase
VSAQTGTDGRARGWSAPIVGVVAGMLAQAMLLALMTLGGLAVLRVTNPEPPPRGATSIDNPLGSWVIVAVLAVGMMPWLSALIMQRMRAWGRAAPAAKAVAVVLWLALFLALAGCAVVAAFFLRVSAIVCPVDAYECPL